MGQLLQLSVFPPLSGLELAAVLFSIVCYSALWAGVAALVGGLSRSAVVWTLLLAASTIYFFDHFSYDWLAAHLNQTVPLLIENLKSFESMRAKLLALVAVAAGFAVAMTAAATGIRYAMRRSLRWSTPASLRQVAAFIVTSALAVAVDGAVSPHLMRLDAYEAKNQVLWHPGAYAPPHPHPRVAIFDIPSPHFRQVPDEETIATVLSRVTAADATRPLNVFVFVLDSLREDAITEDVAPNIFRLKQAALPVLGGVASSNVTHVSWFSIAHALNPLYWSVTAHQERHPGASPVRLLKQLGYRIHALSCSSLEYFGFERSVFGDNLELAGDIVDQRTIRDPQTDTGEGDIDDKIMSRLGRDVDALTPDSRAFYLVMLDSTHHDYRWSARYSPKYRPYTESVSILTVGPDGIGPLKNRYKNAVNFADMLIGEFVQKLEARGLMDDSIIVVTGDHGEEFLEMGRLVHSSSLNRFQTRVPIVIRVPPGAMPDARIPSTVASHLDIFPTVFDVLGAGAPSDALLNGRSLLRGGYRPPAFSAMSATASPDRVMLDSGGDKLILEFDGIRKIGRTLYARRLVASKVLNENDEEVTPGAGGTPGIDQLRAKFQPALEEILER